MVLVNPEYTLDAYYCEGPGVASDVVPGRLGQNAGAPFENAYLFSDRKCATSGHCLMQSSGDGAVSCVLNGVTWTKPVTVWRGQTFQAEDGQLINSGPYAIVSDSQNSNGKRVGLIGPMAGVPFNNVRAVASGTNNVVIYYTNGDTTGLNRFFNISVNGGAAQNKAFPGSASWSKPVGVTVTLSGFVAGNTNTIKFLGDGTHAAPDLDWIEVIQAGTANAGTTACAAGKANIALRSAANGKYWSSRLDANGWVRAQSSVASGWEMFDIVDAGGGMVAIKSRANNLYVATEAAMTNDPLRARSSTIGVWEKYTIVPVNGGYAFRAMANNNYVQANLDLTNDDIQARAPLPGSWETFNCE
jgi:hypothetical protein